jgi:putative NADH-flavin reductase
MHLTIIAATGGVGRQLVTQALAAGHEVTAVARKPRDLPAAARVVTADLSQADPAALASAVRGADAVLSGLGPAGNADAGIASTGTRPVVEAMWATGVKRIVAISASPVATTPSPGRPHPPAHDAGDGFFMRHVGARLARRLFRAVYADLALMEDELRDSSLDWTVVRPPGLTNKPLTGRYQATEDRNARGAFVSRADVAHFMLAALDRPETIGHTFGIAN